jgi:hypothetical protein
MRYICTSIVATLVFAVLLMFSGCNFDTTVQSSVKPLQSKVAVASAAVDASINNGRIKLLADPDVNEATIEAEFTAGGETREQAEVRVGQVSIDAKIRDGKLYVRGVFPEPRFDGDRVDLSITLASITTAQLRTKNGRVLITGASGDVEIYTDNGRVEVSGCTGALHVETHNGRIEVTDHDGGVDLKTDNGKITVALSDASSDPVQLLTDNGSIRLSVGPAFHGEIKVETNNGSIKTDGPADRFSNISINDGRGNVRIGEGGRRSAIKTANGSITIQTR